MFAVVSNIEKIPSVCEICSNEIFLRKRMEQIAINYAIDNVGKKNWINTLDVNISNDISNFSVYPYIILERINENEIKVFKVTKEAIVNKGYFYNSYEYKYDKKEIGSFYFVISDNWKNETKDENKNDVEKIIKHEIIETIKKKETSKKTNPLNTKTFVCFDDVMKEMMSKNKK